MTTTDARLSGFDYWAFLPQPGSVLSAPWIIVRRFPYEEPHHTQIELTVSNGLFAASTDIYCNVEELGKIGSALAAFPKRVPDEYVFEYGSAAPAARCYRHFSLRAFTIGLRGTLGVQFKFNLNLEPPSDGVAEFSLQTDPAQLNRLGVLFTRFKELKHLEFQWDLASAELFQTYQGTLGPLNPELTTRDL